MKTALLGSEAACFEAICKLHVRYSAPLIAFVRERSGATLDGHEITTLVDNVFLELAKKAKDGRLAESGSLASLIFTMAQRNAIDVYRSKRRWNKRNISVSEIAEEGGNEDMSEDDKLIARVARALAAAPGVSASWRTLINRRTAADDTAAKEVIRLFKIWLSSLSRLQRKVAESMVQHFGDATDEQIADEIAKTGGRPPISSVKSARLQIRQKFTAYMEHLERRTEQ